MKATRSVIMTLPSWWMPSAVSETLLRAPWMPSVAVLSFVPERLLVLEDLESRCLSGSYVTVTLIRDHIFNPASWVDFGSICSSFTQCCRQQTRSFPSSSSGRMSWHLQNPLSCAWILTLVLGFIPPPAKIFLVQIQLLDIVLLLGIKFGLGTSKYESNSKLLTISFPSFFQCLSWSNPCTLTKVRRESQYFR